MIVELTQYVSGMFLVAGAIFGLLATLGILRLPDLYTRMHAASKAGIVGTGLIFVGIAVVSLDGAVILRCVIGILFLVLTTPVSAHLLARAAYFVGYRPSDLTVINEMEDNTGTEPK
ncbi:cation:proton antiporter [Devosia sp. 17-2-E-8]|nr:cation:proton antiporter [Devosia sp. 17-2-E-8]